MRVDIAFPAFPPALDGIGDYTAQIANELSGSHNVRVLTAQEDSVPRSDYRVEVAFSTNTRKGILELPAVLAEDPPDWLVLQYNAFSYGRWGLNPWITLLPHRVREVSPSTRIAVMIHEPFVPAENWRFAVMATWQRWQLRSLGQASDVLFFSTEPWARRFQSWFPDIPVHHLPVGSNIPRVPADRNHVRSQLGFTEDDYVIGLFGSGHFSRLLHHVRTAVLSIRQDVPNARVLYIGPAGEKVRRSLSGLPVIDSGALPASEVSRRFSAMDLYLAPFHKGVSSRRGSFLVGLQHGLPTVSTHGIHTGPDLRSEDGRSFLLTSDQDPEAYASATLALATDPGRAKRMSTRGQELYEERYAWPTISHRLCTSLSRVPLHSRFSEILA